MPDLSFNGQEDRLYFPDGKHIYCFRGNPSIGLNGAETTNYGYGSDGGFSVEDIGIPNAILIAEAMIKTWTEHKAYLEGLSNA